MTASAPTRPNVAGHQRYRRPHRVPSEFAVPLTVLTVVVVLTSPVWFSVYVLLFWIGFLEGWSRVALLAVVGGPMLLAALLLALNVSCLRDALHERDIAHTWIHRDESQMRAMWSVVGLVVASIGAVGYLLFLVVSIGA